MKRSARGRGSRTCFMSRTLMLPLTWKKALGMRQGIPWKKPGKNKTCFPTQGRKESRNMALKVGFLKKPARIRQGDCTHSRTVQTYRSRTVQMYRPRTVQMYRPRTVRMYRSRTVRTYSQIRLNILRLNIKIYIPIHLSIHLQGIVRRNTDGRGMIEGTDFVWPLISSGKSCLLMPFSLTALKEGLSWMGFCRYWRKPTVRAAGQSG